MSNFIVLGGYGIIGRAVVADLFKFSDGEIVVAGRNKEKAEACAQSFKSNRVKAQQVDIGNKNELAAMLKKGYVCVNCVQYYYNVEIMKACIKARTNYVDLGGLFHYTKKQLKLDSQFRKIGKIAILGIGAAPGISNILAYYGASALSKVRKVEIVFSNKDETKYEQKFVLPYSFETLVDEYTMKPAVFRNGKTVFVEPHSGIKEYDFGDFGRHEGFLTLHSEIATLPGSLRRKGIKNCEFRVTFPREFDEIMRQLIDLGLTSKNKIVMNGREMGILEVTSRIMNKFVPSHARINDSEIVRVIIDDKLVLDAVTHSDGKTPAGVLDTGISCSIAAQMIVEGEIGKTGVFPPELTLQPRKFFRELRKRNIMIKKNGGVINQ